MTINEWPGVANSADNIPDKVMARVGVDLPEDVERDISARIGSSLEIKNIWRLGVVDLMVSDGQVALRMTPEQAVVWQAVRGE